MRLNIERHVMLLAYQGGLEGCASGPSGQAASRNMPPIPVGFISWRLMLGQDEPAAGDTVLVVA